MTQAEQTTNKDTHASARTRQYTALLKRLAPPRTSVFIGKLAISASLIAVGAFGALSHFWLAKVGGIVLLGLMYAHLIELQHQALHGVGFRSQWWNRVIGSLLGVPMLVSYTDFQVK